MAAVRITEAMPAGAMIGIQPLPYSTTRRSAALPLPPIQIGGCGRCVGLCGHTGSGASKSAPLTGTSGSTQIDHKAPSASSNSSARRSKSTPTAATLGTSSPDVCRRCRSAFFEQSLRNLGAVVANELRTDVRHLCGHVVRIRLHDPLVGGAENRRAEVVDRSIDVDIGPHGFVDDAVSQSRLNHLCRSPKPHPYARSGR